MINTRLIELEKGVIIIIITSVIPIPFLIITFDLFTPLL